MKGLKLYTDFHLSSLRFWMADVGVQLPRDFDREVLDDFFADIEAQNEAGAFSEGTFGGDAVGEGEPGEAKFDWLNATKAIVRERSIQRSSDSAEISE